MQVTEVAAEGLKRAYKVVVPAGEIEGKVDARMKTIARTARMPGFRPGKAPVTLLKKQYGRQVMGEILEEAVKTGQEEAISSNNLRPALRPKVEVTSFPDGGDLEFSMDLEVLPEVPEIDLGALSLTRPVAEVEEAQVERSLEGLGRMRRHHHPLKEPRPAETGDLAVVDFEGSIEGVPFEGGSAEDARLDLGAGRMIPGFEEAIVGHSAGETFSFDVTFPADYAKADLAGKTAAFAVTLKELQAPHEPAVDDDFAKSMGTENLDDLKAKIRGRLVEEYEKMGRARMKRALLDQLADTYAFEVPAGMVELEFQSIWTQLQQEMQRTGQDFAGMGQTEDEVRDEYRSIAERRVRLGLILSDIGTKNNVRVEPQELQQALIEQARQYPGQERQVLDYFRSNQAALDGLRAPIFEDKVVDLVIDKAVVKEEKVSADDLMKDPDEEATPSDEAQEAAAHGENA
ncbi:MAG: trigger factor [Geminicoccaceae bacterium]|nr:trigger factor [Geminicoccaceae bacterium]